MYLACINLFSIRAWVTVLSWFRHITTYKGLMVLCSKGKTNVLLSDTRNSWTRHRIIRACFYACLKIHQICWRLLHPRLHKTFPMVILWEEASVIEARPLHYKQVLQNAVQICSVIYKPSQALHSLACSWMRILKFFSVKNVERVSNNKRTQQSRLYLQTLRSSKG